MKDFIAKIFKPKAIRHSGTAWMASERFALTAFHCIEDEHGNSYPKDELYKMIFESGIEVDATLEAFDPNLDVAILRVLGRTFATQGKLLLGRLPGLDDWTRYSAFRRPLWESFGYPEGFELGLTVSGTIDSPQTKIDGRLGVNETAIQLTCEHGGLGYLNGISGGAVIHDNTVVGLIRSGPADFRSLVIHAVPLERIADVLKPMKAIIQENFEHAMEIVAPNILGSKYLNTSSAYDDERRSSKTKTNLPRPFIYAHGRDKDIVEAKRHLEEDSIRIVTLCGPDGLGKKRLALNVGNEFLNVVDSVFLCDLSPVETDRSLIAIGNILGVKEAHNNLLTESLISEIGASRMIFIIFDAKKLAAFAEQIKRILLMCPNLKIIAVNHTKLGWENEKALKVNELQTSELNPKAPPALLTGFPVITLFTDQVKISYPSFEIDSTNSYFIVQVCQLVGGSPLAIRLAAVLANAYLKDPQEKLVELGGFINKLNAIKDKSVEDRHRALIAMMFETIDIPTRTLICKLSVFRSGFSLDAAEEFDRTSAGLLPTAKKKLLTLLNSNLIFAFGKQELGQRYGIPADIRNFCICQLDRAGEIYARKREHAFYYSRLVSQFERRLTVLGGKDIKASLEILEIEYNDIISALRWLKQNFKEAEIRETGLGIVGNIFWFWNLRGSLNEGRKVFEEIVDDIQVESLNFGAALYCAGGLAFLQGEFGDARKLLTKSIAILEKIQNERRLAYALVILGMVALHSKQPEEALWHERRAVHLFEEIDHSTGLALALNDLANVLIEQGQFEKAEDMYLRSYKLWQYLDNSWGMGLVTSNLGHLNCQTRKYDVAEKWLIESMAIQQNGRYQWGYAESVKRMGYVALAKHDYKSSAGLFYDSLILHQKIGRMQLAADCLDGLAELAVEKEMPRFAVNLLGAATAIRDTLKIGLTPVAEKKHNAILGLAKELSKNIPEASCTFDDYFNEGKNMSISQATKKAEDFAKKIRSE